jgi:capsular polysaccharide biosynthesis protein
VAVHGADQQLGQAVGPNGLGSSIQVIDPPSAEPSQTSKKQLLLDVGIGLIAGLVLAGAFVVWMTAIDRSLRYPEEVAQLLGIRVLASTPNVPALARNGSKKRRSGQ